MKPEQILEALEAAAQKVGLRVRYESLTASGAGGSGGLCKVRGEWWLIVDKKLAPSDRIGMLVEGLIPFDTAGVELPPKIQDTLARRREAARPAERASSGAPAPAPDAPLAPSAS